MKQVSQGEVFERCLNIILRFLAYRTRTRKEIEQRMDKYFRSLKNVDVNLKADVINRIFGYVEANKLIDDSEYAKLYVESKSKGKKALGKRSIAQKLIAKGISRADAENYVNEMVSEEDEVRVAVDLLAKKYKKLDGVTNRDVQLMTLQQREKMGKYLMSRGFSYQVIKQAVDYFLKRPYNQGRL